MKKPLFIISSAIDVSKNPLCYTSVRTVFSVYDRAKQTIQTIESIRSKMPEAKILMVESGIGNQLPYGIKSMVDGYLFLGENKEMREASDGPYKGLGEAMSLYLADPIIRTFDADYFFKLSGRYYLDDAFNPDAWKNDGYTGRFYAGVMTTVLYGFPKRLYPDWHAALKKSYPALLRGESLENALPRELEQKFISIPRIGASGWISHSGEFCSL